MSIRNLKTILILDAATCAGVFLLGLFAAAPVGALLGLPAGVVATGGWICLAAALLMLFAARQAVPGAALMKLIALGNIGWVAASLGVVAAFGAAMTGLGLVVVLAQAAAVFAFAIVEWKGADAGGRVAAV